MARPNKFTKEVQTRILLALRAGAHPVVAAQMAGIGASTLFHWMADPRPRFQVFREQCQKAIAEFEVLLIGTIQQGARQSPAAAIKLLERRHPERWGHARAALADVQPELGPDPNEPPPPTNGPGMLTLPPEWTPLWLAMYYAALRGESPEDFLRRPDPLVNPDDVAGRDRVARLTDDGYGFGQGTAGPDEEDGEPDNSEP